MENKRSNLLCIIKMVSTMRENKFVVKQKTALILYTIPLLCNVILVICLSRRSRDWCDICMIVVFFLVILLPWLYFLCWSVKITKKEICITGLFQKTRIYRTNQIKRVMYYTSTAERGAVLWVQFHDGKWLKVAHSYQNFEKFHGYLAKKVPIEWK